MASRDHVVVFDSVDDANAYVDATDKEIGFPKPSKPAGKGSRHTPDSKALVMHHALPETYLAKPFVRIGPFEGRMSGKDIYKKAPGPDGKPARLVIGADRKMKLEDAERDFQKGATPKEKDKK